MFTSLFTSFFLITPTTFLFHFNAQLFESIPLPFGVEEEEEEEEAGQMYSSGWCC